MVYTVSFVMTKVKHLTWVHGYGVHPSSEKLAGAARTVATANSGRITLGIPALTRHPEKGVLVAPPLEEQARHLRAELEKKPEGIVCHSQGAWVLALALHELEDDPSWSPELTLLAPALTSPIERVTKGLQTPTAREHAHAADLGGAHGVLHWAQNGPQSLIVSAAYMESVSNPSFQPDALVMELLEFFDGAARIIRPDRDNRLGDQRREYDEIAATGVRVAEISQSNHRFSGMEEAIARVSLLGFGVETVGANTYAAIAS